MSHPHAKCKLTDVILLDAPALNHQDLSLALLDGKLPDVADVSGTRRVLLSSGEAEARDERVAWRGLLGAVDGRFFRITDTAGISDRKAREFRAALTGRQRTV